MHLVLALLLAATYNEKLDVRLHSVDVIVTDAKGDHAGGLTANDFDILENGVPQKITNFAEYAEKPAAEAAADPLPPRHFAVFIDEMTLHPVTRRRLVASIHQLIDRILRVGDELMIVRPASSGTFTSDRAAIDTALAKAMEDSKLDLQSPRVIDDQRFVNSIRSMNLSKASRLMAERQRQKIEQRLGTIRAAVTTLSELPGRKFVIVVTESLPAQPGREGCAIGNHVAKAAPDVPGEYMRADYVDLTPEFQDIARTASANGITIYGFQPEVGSPVAPVDTAGHPDAGAARALANSEDGMNVLTELTGGTWYRGDTRADDVMRQVALDMQSYYSLAYHTQGQLETALRVEVRVRNHPELHVRTRSETINKSPRRELTDRVVSSLIAASPRNDLGINAHPAGSKRNGKLVSTTVDVVIPIEKLTFEEENGVHRARFTVHYAISGERLDFVSGVDREQLVEIPDTDWERARSQQWTHSLHFNTRLGPHRLAVGVLDSSSMTWGINALTIDAK
ncbi:MAG: hypothetical protein DMF56_09450 [Acidobacteria bacterium]|nr:MAG: hypothetical protein DMF56_09450 [Acidobacteriota bacterium]